MKVLEGSNRMGCMILNKTGGQKKDWERVREMPKGYKWETQWAARKNKKGRAMGMMVGMRGGIKIRRDKRKEKEGGKRKG